MSSFVDIRRGLTRFTKTNSHLFLNVPFSWYVFLSFQVPLRFDHMGVPANIPIYRLIPSWLETRENGMQRKASLKCDAIGILLPSSDEYHSHCLQGSRITYPRYVLRSSRSCSACSAFEKIKANVWNRECCPVQTFLWQIFKKGNVNSGAERSYMRYIVMIPFLTCSRNDALCNLLPVKTETNVGPSKVIRRYQAT